MRDAAPTSRVSLAAGLSALARSCPESPPAEHCRTRKAISPKSVAAIMPIENTNSVLGHLPTDRLPSALYDQRLLQFESGFSDATVQAMSANEKQTSLRAAKSFRKDATLDRLANLFNVAQFVSFAPSAAGPVQQYCRLADLEPNHSFDTVGRAIDALFERAAYGTVNIRSFSETASQSREFLYALKSRSEVLSALERLSAQGDFTIANETIDVSDGGVSGVILDEVVEFRPDATPRGVEMAGFASLPASWAKRALEIVYGVAPDIDQARGARLEFSLHPSPRGYKRSHILYWEYGEHAPLELPRSDAVWPNDFSRMMGDKAYGLLIAHLAGFPVPRTTVIGRRLPPFSFGDATGSLEWWTRTCPAEQVPGKFTTVRGWIDPFKLLASEDPTNNAISSVLCQHAVQASYSGAAIEGADGKLYIEGTPGTGEAFMQGMAVPARLPVEVIDHVTVLHKRLSMVLGSVRFEWVFDGRSVWIVQLHRGRSASAGRQIVPGERRTWITFRIEEGLEALRKKLETIPSDAGLILDGDVGLTSHVADVIRKSGVPARISVPDQRINDVQ